MPEKTSQSADLPAPRRRSGATTIEILLWAFALLALLPYPLAGLARWYYGAADSAEILLAAEASGKGAALPGEPQDGPPNPAPAVENTSFIEDAQLWSAQRLQAFDRLVRNLSGAAAPQPAGTLVLPGQRTGIAVFEGATEAHMTLGAGRLRETSPLDGDGNIALSAHRDGAFRALKDLSLGDRLRLRTPSGERVFEVTNLSVVNPDAVHVLDPTEVPSLTLTTCYPFYFVGSAPERYIVRAELASSVDAEPGSDPR